MRIGKPVSPRALPKPNGMLSRPTSMVPNLSLPVIWLILLRSLASLSSFSSHWMMALTHTRTIRSGSRVSQLSAPMNPPLTSTLTSDCKTVSPSLFRSSALLRLTMSLESSTFRTWRWKEHSLRLIAAMTISPSAQWFRLQLPSSCHSSLLPPSERGKDDSLLKIGLHLCEPPYSDVL